MMDILKDHGRYNMTQPDAITEAQQIDAQYHYFTTLLKKPLQRKTEGKLAGYSISVKDAILVKDVETTASSAILKGYKPLFNATVVERVLEAGGSIIGKTCHDEFGFGAFNVNVSHGRPIPLNPHNEKCSCGGSSGGSAGFSAKTTLKHISLGESTGGSIVCPASFCGVVGLCPTYGRVSRNGLIDYGNSLDKIGPIAQTVYDVALMLEVIAGNDKKDSTSADVTVPECTKAVTKSIKGMKIGVIRDNVRNSDKNIAHHMEAVIEYLRSEGAIIDDVTLPIANEYGLSVYYIIGTAEASTNLAKYCGMRYGVMNEPSGKSFNTYFSDIRSKEFNDETKRRIMLGTFTRMAGSRDAFYIKAAKVRTKIIEEYKSVFDKYDVLLSPTMPCTAPLFDAIKTMTPLQHYLMDSFLVGANVAGLPHITVPTGKDKDLPIGTMIIGDHFAEEQIISAGAALEAPMTVATNSFGSAERSMWFWMVCTGSNAPQL